MESSRNLFKKGKCPFKVVSKENIEEFLSKMSIEGNYSGTLEFLSQR